MPYLSTVSAMKRAYHTALAVISLVVAVSCSNNTETAARPAALTTAAAGVTRQLKDAGGVVVKVGGSIVRFDSKLAAFEVGAGTASHYKFVNGSVYVDASVGDKEAYVEGTDENLKKLGVDPAQVKQDALLLLLLMNLPGSLSSWSEGITSRVTLSDRTVRVTVKQESLKNSLAAGLKPSTDFFFTTGPDGTLSKWGIVDRPGAALEVVSYEKVSVEQPASEVLVAVGNTP